MATKKNKKGKVLGSHGFFHLRQQDQKNGNKITHTIAIYHAKHKVMDGFKTIENAIKHIENSTYDKVNKKFVE